ADVRYNIHPSDKKPRLSDGRKLPKERYPLRFYSPPVRLSRFLGSERTGKMTPPSGAEARQAAAGPSTGLLSSAFRHLPLFFPLTPPKPSALDHTATDHVEGPHSSLLSAAERCVKALAAALSQQPFLKPLLSVRSDFQSFCQMRRKGPTIATFPSAHSFAAILPGDSVSLYGFLFNFSTLCDPYLNIFRGIIPPLGGTLDLSPILAFLVLDAFTSTAAALPAELPATQTARQNASSTQRLSFSLTTTQEKWLRRVNSRRSKNLDDAC
ncbi:hypothetical protein GW17_00050102, partial [Ensete ventricosum]